MISNYFYGRWALLRLIVLPFLLLLSLGLLVLLSWLLQAVGIFDFNLILDNPLTHSLGITGQVLRAVCWLRASSSCYYSLRQSLRQSP